MGFLPWFLVSGAVELLHVGIPAACLGLTRQRAGSEASEVHVASSVQGQALDVIIINAAELEGPQDIAPAVVLPQVGIRSACRGLAGQRAGCIAGYVHVARSVYSNAIYEIKSSAAELAGPQDIAGAVALLQGGIPKTPGRGTARDLFV